MKKILALLIIAAAFTSCYTFPHLHQSGTYTIKERNGDITEFYEVKGRYTIKGDTLKKNDKILINVIRSGVVNKGGKIKGDIVKAF